MDKQRRQDRLRTRLKALVTDPASGRVQRTLTGDLSAGGASLDVEQLLIVGTRVDVDIELPDGHRWVRCAAEVVRSEMPGGLAVQAKHPKIRIRVKFLRLDDESQALLRQYLAINPPLDPGDMP
jgi:hypothetical protein